MSKTAETIAEEIYNDSEIVKKGGYENWKEMDQSGKDTIIQAMQIYAQQQVVEFVEFLEMYCLYISDVDMWRYKLTLYRKSDLYQLFTQQNNK